MSKQTKFAPEDEVVGCIPLQLDENHAKELTALAESVPIFSDVDCFGVNVSTLNPRFTMTSVLTLDKPIYSSRRTLPFRSSTVGFYSGETY